MLGNCCRREELKEALTSSDKAQELLQKYSLEALGESLLAYVTKARAALGPPLLKVCRSYGGRPLRMMLLLQVIHSCLDTFGQDS